MTKCMANVTIVFVVICTMFLVGACAGRPKGEGGVPAVKAPPPPDSPPAVPAQKFEPLDPEIHTTARRQIELAFASNDPVLRANAIEAAQDTMGGQAAPMILTGLKDPSAAVRFSAAMSAGELRLREAYHPLLGMVNDPSRNVQVAVRFALHRLGDTSYSHDLEKTARDPSRSVRGDTAMVLGLLGEKSAIKILRVMMNDNEAVVRLQVAEAMWRLGDQQGLTVLATGTVSRFPDDQMIAVIAIAEPRDKRVIEHVRGKLTSEWPEVALVAARAMGELGSDEGYGIALRGARSSDPRQKALAALALGAIGRSDSQQTLENLMKDGDPNVRLAAATAALQLTDPTVTRAQ